MTIGCFPIRDIIQSLPDVTKQFAAEILLLGLRPGHHTFRRGNDGHAHAAEHARNLGRADVAAQSRAC